MKFCIKILTGLLAIGKAGSQDGVISICSKVKTVFIYFLNFFSLVAQLGANSGVVVVICPWFKKKSPKSFLH